MGAGAWNQLRRVGRRLFSRRGEMPREDYGSTTMLASSPDSRPSTSDYTELMAGSVPCPSCKGSGRIPKEMEETLVALIPMDDERLQPKKTWQWVLFGVAICVLLASAAIFMLVPREVELSSTRPPIEHINVIESDPDHIRMHFLNRFNISNHNYYSVRVVNSSATVIDRFQPWTTDMIGTGANNTEISVAPLSTSGTQLYFNCTVNLKGFTAEYCQKPFSKLTSLYVNMRFDITVTLEYFNHREQIALQTTQQVCCVPSGNCTSF